MNTPKELQKIYNRLPKEKVDLSTHKVALSITGDIKKALGQSKSLDSKGSKQEDKLINLGEKVTEIKNKYFDAADASKALLSQMDDSSKESVKLIEKAEEAAKTLGVNASDIEGYFDLKDSISNLNQGSERLDKEIKFAQK